jgi:hypothetical protein
VQQFAALAENFTLSWDIGVIAFLIFGVFFYGFSVGPRKLGSMLISVYLGYVIMNLLPFVSGFVSDMPEHRVVIIDLAVFSLLVIAIFFLTAGSVLRSVLGLPSKEDRKWWHLVLLSSAIVGFFTASFLALLPEEYYSRASTITLQVFVYNNASFWWALFGILVIAILRRRK